MTAPSFDMPYPSLTQPPIQFSVNSKQRIFITGVSGFVGRVLTKYLNALGHEIYGLVHELHDTLPPSAVYFGDVRDQKILREILLEVNPTIIIHLAAKALVKQGEHDAFNTFDVNVNGTINMLDAWQQYAPAAAFFLHFSSDKVYGEGQGKKETDALMVQEGVNSRMGAYAASKAAADMIAQSYLHTGRLAIARSANIYGPGDRNFRLIPCAIQDALKGQVSIGYWHNGKTALREYVYIDDLCLMVTALLDHRAAGIWNLGSGQALTTAKVRAMIGPHRFIEAPYPELMEQSLDTSKFWSLFCPNSICAVTPFRAGLEKTQAWWKNQLSPPLSLQAA